MLSDSSHFRFFRSGSVRNIQTIACGSLSPLAHSLEGGRGWCETSKRQTVYAVDGRDCSQILVLGHCVYGLGIQIVVNLFSHRSCCLVLGWIGLCKPCEVIYYQQNVPTSPLAFLQMEKVHGDHLKRGSCRKALHWCFGRDPRLFC